MRIHFFRPLFVSMVLLLGAASFAQAKEQPTDRVSASFLLALGRLPTTDEVNQWSQPSSLALTELLKRHRQHLQQDEAARRASLTAAAQDAFGRSPREGELVGAAEADSTYSAALQRHLQWLQANPAEYAQVVHRAYRFLLRREAYAEELEYWSRHDTLSYVLLIGCIEDWARRNQPGLMVTSGTPTVSRHSRFLTTVPLSLNLAAEALAALGPDSPSAFDLRHAQRRLLVAPGAEKVVTGGGVSFVAAGSARLREASDRP